MRTVWLEDCAQEEQRESEEEDAEAAIAEHEEDRSPAAGEENLGASAVYRAMADLPRKAVSTPVWLATTVPRGSDNLDQ